jgi:hypothetical protein
MISVLASSAVDGGFEPRSGHIKDLKNGSCCFSAKHAALRRMSKDWLARNHINVSKWCEMSTRGLLYQGTSTMKIQRSVLV